MRFKDVFSIIGPSMIGPSSSHTAGAVLLGRVARKLLAELPQAAHITFYGSFADTYRGHGTDIAIVAGILDMETDDPGIVASLDTAEEAGVAVEFATATHASHHPNTARIRLTAGERELTMVGSSIGGGNIRVFDINGFDVHLSGNYSTLVVFHSDYIGLVYHIAKLLSEAGINIGHMSVDRKGRHETAVTVVEADQLIGGALLERLRALPEVAAAVTFDLRSREGTQ